MRIYDKSMTLIQDNDTWDGSGDYHQELVVQTFCIEDNDHYLTLETKRWALDKQDIRKFADLLISILDELEKQPNDTDNRIPDHLS